MRRGKKELRLGLWILAAVFIVAALTAALKGEDTSVGQTLSEKDVGDAQTETEAGTDVEEQEEGTGQTADQNIRVLILSDGYRQEAHPSVTLSADAEWSVTYGDACDTYEGNTEVTFQPDQACFSEGTVTVKAKEGKIRIESLTRGDGTPSYAGTIELYATAEGIIVINELSVEDYLCGVTPSEMPSSYEMEALKAQAVCARSYAYRQMQEYAYPTYRAHVNDGTDYQVYNNSEQTERSSQAVFETGGETVQYQGKTVTTYYYSTSCGRTTTVEAWGTKDTGAYAYLQSVEVTGENGDYEKELPWYRWTATIPTDTLSDLVGLNLGKDLGQITNIEVTERGPGDVALAVRITGEAGEATVETENKIRRAFGGETYQIRLNDGSETTGQKLLPSAFFDVEKTDGGFCFSGGGFGHGIGMSQTGANEMAKQGKTYREILQTFYTGVEIAAADNEEDQ